MVYTILDFEFFRWDKGFMAIWACPLIYGCVVKCTKMNLERAIGHEYANVMTNYFLSNRSIVDATGSKCSIPHSYFNTWHNAISF